MENVIVTHASRQAQDSDILQDIFRLRYEAFSGRLKWDVEVKDGIERDRFDDMDAFHIAIKDGKGSVGGCWRALPSTGDYMLKTVFPELLQGEVAPDDAFIWEISRFAVRKGSSATKKGMSAEITVDMVRSLYLFAKQNHINSYVAVTTVACERILRQLGVECRRLGAGQALRIGKELSVALSIEVNEKMCVVTH